MYSAKSSDGECAYEAAREGRKLELKPCKIIVHQIELLDYDIPKMEIRVVKVHLFALLRRTLVKINWWCILIRTRVATTSYV